QWLKRLDLLVESFRHVKNKDLRAVIIGEGPEEKNLRQKIAAYNLEKRIELIGKSDEKSVISHYARCRAVFFAPLREDYGFVTGEAFSSRKAVITAIDSGGPQELVKKSQAGYILPADPEKIAEKLDAVAESESLAIQLGNLGFRFISQVTWEDTIRRLVIV
ncbi:MAG: glycosyltransferase, partial [Candidatus Aminicenantes bacterium]|nr:glycosyltransferase [Candidatus Aminicenantes bacterium]